MHIEIKVEDLESIDLSAVIGEEIRHYNPETDGYDTRPRTLGDAVAEKLAEKLYGSARHADLYREARALREKIIAEEVRPAIVAALTGEIQRTNSFGEPTGQTVTLRELIALEAKNAVMATSTSRGGRTLLQQVIREEVDAAFRKELLDAVKEEKEKVVKAVAVKASTIIAETVKAAIQ